MKVGWSPRDGKYAATVALSLAFCKVYSTYVDGSPFVTICFFTGQLRSTGTSNGFLELSVSDERDDNAKSHNTLTIIAGFQPRACARSSQTIICRQRTPFSGRRLTSVLPFRSAITMTMISAISKRACGAVVSGEQARCPGGRQRRCHQGVAGQYRFSSIVSRAIRFANPLLRKGTVLWP